jgi:hypothetical protein
MSAFNGWVRKLEKKNGSNTVTIPQLDGSEKIFPSGEFFLGLFCAQADASAGVQPTGPVVDALESATPETIERIEQLAASGMGGDFLRRAVETGGLLEVAEDAGDLSEQA